MLRIVCVFGHRLLDFGLGVRCEAGVRRCEPYYYYYYLCFIHVYVRLEGWMDGRTVVCRAGRLVRTTYRQTDRQCVQTPQYVRMYVCSFGTYRFKFVRERQPLFFQKCDPLRRYSRMMYVGLMIHSVSVRNRLKRKNK